MYPMLKDGVSIGTYQYEGSDTIHYYVENEYGEEFEIGRGLWNALLQADGTKPLDLPDGGKKILPELKRYELVSTSRFVLDDGLFNRFILFIFGSRVRGSSVVYRRINAALPMVSVLILASSICLMKLYGAEPGGEFSWWLYYILILGSITLHEAGHLVAGLAYGYTITDAGILLFGFIPIGAYVANEEKEEVSAAEEIQFALAGVEMNLLIAGVFFLIAILNDLISLTMVLAAKTNLYLASTNLLPVFELDGEYALSAAFGVKSISETARKWLFSRKRRRKLFHSGFPGYICFGIFIFIQISRILFWVLVGLNLKLVLTSSL